MRGRSKPWNLLRSTTTRDKDSSSGAYADPNRVMSLRSPRALANARPNVIPTSSESGRHKCVHQKAMEQYISTGGTSFEAYKTNSKVGGTSLLCDDRQWSNPLGISAQCSCRSSRTKDGIDIKGTKLTFGRICKAERSCGPKIRCRWPRRRGPGRPHRCAN